MPSPRFLLSCLLLTVFLPGMPLAQSQAPVAWTAHPDGRPHWYQLVIVPSGIDWIDAQKAALAAGGHLATVTSEAENDEIFKLVDVAAAWQLGTVSKHWEGPWIGGVQGATSSEPGGNWGWTEVEALSFTKWATGQPNDQGKADRMHFGGDASGRTASWADAPADTKLLGYVIEYDGAMLPRTLGLQLREPESYDGYTLFAPTRSVATYLVDPRGRVVNSWLSKHLAGIVCYLLPSGNLLRTGWTDNDVFAIGGSGGLIEEFDWNGNLLWEFEYSTPQYCQHHDIARLPNGNVLMIAWEYITEQEALAAGRDPKLLPDKRLYPDKIVEVVPTGPKSGQIVWEWRAWDHLIQDFDSSKANYGKVADHPERIDLNYVAYEGRDDWMHANAVDYNPYLDQIAISVRSFDEVWIIDHSTTTAEARTGQGGRSGMGGRLLYRYGNPRAYRRGTENDQKLFKQHDVHWIEPGLPGAGNLMIFNNGILRQDGNYSSVDEITPPTPDAQGRYAMLPSGVWGPEQMTWTYQAPKKEDFFSRFVSGAQRQPNGNTVICAGWLGETFEVTNAGKVVWRYMNPIHSNTVLPQGHPGSGGQMVFRSYRYGPGYGAFVNKQVEAGDPLEFYATALLANGSTVPARVATGKSGEFDLISVDDPGALYLMGTSITPGAIPIGHRQWNVGFDSLLPLSMGGGAPGLFDGYFGRLDNEGRATARLTIPELPGLGGLRFYTAFLVFDPGAPDGISRFSNQVEVVVR